MYRIEFFRRKQVKQSYIFSQEYQRKVEFILYK